MLVDTTVKDPSFAVSQVSSDNVGGGAAAFTAIKALNPKGGKVLVDLRRPRHLHHRRPGEGLRGRRQGRLRSFTYLGVQYSHNDPATAAQLVTAALQKDPDIVGIFATNLFAAEGSATGIKQAGKNGQVNDRRLRRRPGPDQGTEGRHRAGPRRPAAGLPSAPTAWTRRSPALDGGTITPKIQTGFTIITRQRRHHGCRLQGVLLVLLASSAEGPGT